MNKHAEVLAEYAKRKAALEKKEREYMDKLEGDRVEDVRVHCDVSNIGEKKANRSYIEYNAADVRDLLAGLDQDTPVGVATKTIEAYTRKLKTGENTPQELVDALVSFDKVVAASSLEEIRELFSSPNMTPQQMEHNQECYRYVSAKLQNHHYIKQILDDYWVLKDAEAKKADAGSKKGIKVILCNKITLTLDYDYEVGHILEGGRCICTVDIRAGQAHPIMGLSEKSKLGIKNVLAKYKRVEGLEEEESSKLQDLDGQTLEHVTDEDEWQELDDE